MQVAIITKTGEQVEIVATNGGWTTVHTLGADTREMKVRNGALSGHTAVTGQAAEMAMKVAEKARLKADEKARRARAAAPVAEGVEERRNGVVFAGYLPQYEAYKALTTEGATKRSIDKGDAVALQLRPLVLMSVYATVSNATGVAIKDLTARFGHLNPGMQRMNLGNMLRRALREAAANAA